MIFSKMAARLSAFATHFVGFIILPAQLPGDPMDIVQDLTSDPIGTLRTLDWSTFRALIRQIWTSQKLTLPHDATLERLHETRTKYLSRGWAHCPLTTVDGLTLDAFWKQPATTQIAPRFIVFVGGNAQKYEDWLPYFQLYADESEFGFLCFNFRGVARSEGVINHKGDMLNDVRAAVDFLVERGVQPHHILLHGFSLGGAIAALFLAEPGAPRAAITSDRSFRSYCHAAFGLMRGFNAAVGDERPPLSDRSAGPSLAEVGLVWWVRAHCARALVTLLLLVRALVGTFAYAALKATDWELNALEAWRKIPGKKVLVYNVADNIVAYGAASLHAALVAEDGTGSDDGESSGGATSAKGHAGGAAGGGAFANATVVEVTLRYAQGWALHDFPLSLDLDAWYAMIAAERAALGVAEDGGQEMPAGGGGLVYGATGL